MLYDRSPDRVPVVRAPPFLLDGRQELVAKIFAAIFLGNWRPDCLLPVSYHNHLSENDRRTRANVARGDLEGISPRLKVLRNEGSGNSREIQETWLAKGKKIVCPADRTPLEEATRHWFHKLGQSVERGCGNLLVNRSAHPCLPPSLIPKKKSRGAHGESGLSGDRPLSPNGLHAGAVLTPPPPRPLAEPIDSARDEQSSWSNRLIWRLPPGHAPRPITRSSAAAGGMSCHPADVSSP